MSFTVPGSNFKFSHLGRPINVVVIGWGSGLMASPDIFPLQTIFGQNMDEIREKLAAFRILPL